MPSRPFTIARIWILSLVTAASTAAQSIPGAPTVRAHRVTDPIRVDGKLDEPIYASTEAISGFVQQEPDEGKPATEKTEAWIFFDDRNIYVSARCYESHPERRVANEMRRDTVQLRQNDHFAVLFDTFHDKRNRSEERRVGKECRIRCRSRWSPYH